MSEIIDELLLTTRLDRGQLRVEREPIEVAALTRATVLTMAPQLPDSIAIEVEMQPVAVLASGDRDRIQQVLLNLLDNAVKYGGPPIRVHIDQTDGVVRISVADGGGGVPVGEQERIFEKFYRSDPQLRRSPGGTGLGLYISRELAERMGGRLRLRSLPGAGATFSLELPCA